MWIQLAVNPEPEGQLGDHLETLSNLNRLGQGLNGLRRSSWMDEWAIMYLGPTDPPSKYRMA